ncbi:MAG: MBL fold metallo-hydrolase [Spirochaetia bacterium]|nr:MBL fold metallo-hydrolase [Spirochaetia bacterium]
MNTENKKSRSAVLTMNLMPVDTYLNNEVELGISFWWLGQAGFLLRGNGKNLIIDAYLSDVLADKYRGKQFPHVRMMDPPLLPEDLVNIDAVLCTHSHSDHMDPGLLSVIAANNPECVFIMPEAARNVGISRGVPDSRIIGMDAGDTLSFGDVFFGEGVTVFSVPAAHEILRVNDSGRHLFLGYVLQFGSVTVYHSGDCVPFEEMDTWLNDYTIDIQLLPVNGRSRILTDSGIAGNFTIEEALQVMEKHDIKYMVLHHFGMFAFNTADVNLLQEKIEKAGKQDHVFPARIGIKYAVTDH